MMLMEAQDRKPKINHLHDRNLIDLRKKTGNPLNDEALGLYYSLFLVVEAIIRRNKL